MVLLHFELARVIKHVRHLSAEKILFLSSIALRLIIRSIRKPTLYIPTSSTPTPSKMAQCIACTPSLHKKWYPHPMSAILPFPLLRGITTTLFIGSYMSSLSMLNPLTIFTKFMGHAPLLDTVEEVNLPDGIASVVWQSVKPPAILNQPLILILPGMNNSSETGFVRRLSRHLGQTTPCHITACDYRHVGHSQCFNSTSTRPCCADNWSDIPHVIKYLEDKYKPSSLIVIGQSLGGGMGLKCFGMTSPNVTAFIAVSPPVDYTQITKHLESNPIR